ncbi:nitrite reductase large subunit NirB [Domibacillus sp. A3M-37]|uniref:nitrite reductase large subunit NirB n=1 Tax=Domibacillus sp. A3M-37 TaxID=2962037 RepID=UPI0020B8C520|nr:nitrite reductase large subunit NirB [Domibacillus sp. A3M-37]MCP3763032.1 nitrite reductase large subunit NirB [Domibacillus sp. A3M-37]
MSKRKLVVIGNGMAGVRTVEEILAIHPDKFEITIFGKEPHPNYNRILLSKVLQGDTTVESITLNDWSWYEAHQITLYTGEPVIQINTGQKYVVTLKNQIVPYDELIIATGSLPFMLPLPGAKKEGVTAFRDIYDCEKMVETSKKYNKAIVIGGGLLGLEAARGLLNLGMQVDVVHIGEYIMDRQLDPAAARMLQKELEEQGMNFLLQKNSAEITGHKRVKGLRFSDGSWREADLIVMAVGVRPNTEVVAGTDIETNRAILVDDYMRTNIPNVYAVGECAEHRGFVYGLVAPLYEQGKALAATLCGQEHAGYQGSVLSTQLKVSGVDVFSSGEFMDSDETQSLQWFDGIKNTYKKIIVRDKKVTGAVLFGDISEGAKLLGMIQKKTDYAVLEKEMSSGSSNKDELIASMADHDIVCACNGVSKGTIVSAVCEQELESVDHIKACTKASSSCGGCRPVVTDILDFIKRNGAETGTAKEAICACTGADHLDIIEAIQLCPNESREQIMKRLYWKNDTGCGICRPALLYYMGMHSSELPDIVEEQTADGTYMTAPRMYGGVTGAEQLRKIADVVEKYEIPLVKLVPGPRMGLYGIEPDSIAAVRAELSAAAPLYGEELRAVGTCAGIRYAKGALQDSISLGRQLEQKLESFVFPARITLAVSSNLNDEAKSLREEVGLIGAPGGWELYTAGERLYVTMEQEDAIRMTETLLSYYRESAFYGETMDKWLGRLGVITIREEVLKRKIEETVKKNQQAAVAL